MSSRFASLSDEDLLRMLNEIADTCVRVVEMSPAERHHVGKKGTSPEQAATLSAVLVLHLDREATRRGLRSTASPEIR